MGHTVADGLAEPDAPMADRGVTFDEAFRRGFGGAAQILSGNGDHPA